MIKMPIEKEFTDDQIKILKPILKDFGMDKDNEKDRNIMMTHDGVIFLMPVQSMLISNVLRRKEDDIIVFNGNYIQKAIKILEKLGEKEYYFQTFDGISPIRILGKEYEIYIAPSVNDEAISRENLEDYVVKN